VSQQATTTRRKKKAVATTMEVCSVRLGRGVFGIPISRVLEIIGGAQPQHVPLAPGFVGGLVHYRGDVLTTVSLRQVLDMPPSDGRQDILVLDSPSGCFGILVDSVGEVLRISTAELEPNPSTLDDSRRGLFTGACKLKDNLMVMLDPEKLDPVHLGAAQAA